MFRAGVLKSLIAEFRYFVAALAVVFSPAPAFAHPHHAGEVGFAHGLMHAIGWDAHSAPLVMGALWVIDIAVLLIGARMVLKASKDPKASSGSALGRAFCAVGILGASLLGIASY